MNALPRHELNHADGRRVLVYGTLADGAVLGPGAETHLGEIHRRLDPLTGEWIVVSPHRNVRPNDPEPGPRMSTLNSTWSRTSVVSR